MTNVTYSNFDEEPRRSRARLRPQVPPPPRISKYLDHSEPSPYRTLTNNPEMPATPPKQANTVIKQPKKKPSPIKFPEGSPTPVPNKSVKARLDLKGKLDGKKASNSTPNNPTKKVPIRHRLSTGGSVNPPTHG